MLILKSQRLEFSQTNNFEKSKTQFFSNKYFFLKSLNSVFYVFTITELSVSIHNTTNGIIILIKPVSAAEDRIPDSFQCYHLY